MLDQARAEILDQYLDSAKAKRALGWTARHSLDQGLTQTIDLVPDVPGAGGTARRSRVMRFVETRSPAPGWSNPSRAATSAGSLRRVWCRDEFAARGLRADFVQCNSSFNHKRGTLRGLHYQAAPHGEIKLVTCIRAVCSTCSSICAPESPTYRRWFGAELTAENRRLLYVPEGCAHGYLTLEDTSEVLYPVTEAYRPESERGLRWNDPAIGIEWPMPPAVISAKDREWPAAVKRVLVTGATGCIGRHVLPRLVRNGWEVHAVSSPAGFNRAARRHVASGRPASAGPGIGRRVRGPSIAPASPGVVHRAGKMGAGPRQFHVGAREPATGADFAAAGGRRAVVRRLVSRIRLGLRLLLRGAHAVPSPHGLRHVQACAAVADLGHVVQRRMVVRLGSRVLSLRPLRTSGSACLVGHSFASRRSACANLPRPTDPRLPVR